MKHTNPFRFGDLALDEAFTDRAASIAELVAVQPEAMIPPGGIYKYYPGTLPVPEFAAANTRGRSYKILAQVDIDDGDRDGRVAAARRDLARGLRRVRHLFPREVLAVRVARGVAARDAHAEAERDAAAERADLLLLERVVRGDAELEVEVGVVAARTERDVEQAVRELRIDRSRASCRERRAQRRGKNDCCATGAEYARTQIPDAPLLRLRG